MLGPRMFVLGTCICVPSVTSLRLLVVEKLRREGFDFVMVEVSLKVHQNLERLSSCFSTSTFQFDFLFFQNTSANNHYISENLR